MNLERIIPHIPSQNLDETIAFFTDILGFKVISQNEAYSELSLNNKEIFILASEGKPNQQSIYLQVSDIDELWNMVEAPLKEADARAPFDRDYGMREVHVVIPATNTLLFIGSAIDRSLEVICTKQPKRWGVCFKIVKKAHPPTF